MKLRFTHPKSIWFSILKIPNFIILSISSISFNAFLFLNHIINNLLNKMFLVHVLHAKTSFPVTHISDPFKRAYHSLSDFSDICFSEFQQYMDISGIIYMLNFQDIIMILHNHSVKQQN